MNDPYVPQAIVTENGNAFGGYALTAELIQPHDGGTDTYNGRGLPDVKQRVIEPGHLLYCSNRLLINEEQQAVVASNVNAIPLMVDKSNKRKRDRAKAFWSGVSVAGVSRTRIDYDPRSDEPDPKQIAYASGGNVPIINTGPDPVNARDMIFAVLPDPDSDEHVLQTVALSPDNAGAIAAAIDFSPIVGTYLYAQGKADGMLHAMEIVHQVMKNVGNRAITATTTDYPEGMDQAQLQEIADALATGTNLPNLALYEGPKPAHKAAVETASRAIAEHFGKGYQDHLLRLYEDDQNGGKEKFDQIMGQELKLSCLEANEANSRFVCTAQLGAQRGEIFMGTMNCSSGSLLGQIA